MKIDIVERYLNELNLKRFQITDIKSGFSGVFDSVQTAVDAVKRYEVGRTDRSLYVTLNEVSERFFTQQKREGEGIRKRKHSATDSDIAERKNILIDFDPERMKGTPATPEQKTDCLKIAKAVSDLLKEKLGCAPFMGCDSGNGIHLYFRASGDCPVDGLEVPFLLSQVSAFVSETFPDCGIDVDCSVGNPARLARIAGIDNDKTETQIQTKILKTQKGEALNLALLTAKAEARLKEIKELRAQRLKDCPEGEDTEEKIRSALNAIDADCSHREWIQILYALKAWHPEKGEGIAREWSETGSSFNHSAETQIQKVFYDPFPPDRITVATLFHHAKESGWTPPRDERARDYFKGVELPKETALPDMPDVFPEILKAKANEIAQGTGIPAYASLSASLSIVSALICDKVQVTVAPSWKEKLVWNSVLVADSGKRKSSMMRSLLEPVQTSIREKMEDYHARQAVYLAKKSEMEKTLAKDIKDMPNPENHVKQIQSEIESYRPAFPNFLIQDATPEAFLATLEATKDRRGITKLMLTTDEGQQAFNAFTGHYAKGQTNNAIYLQGHDGASYTGNRKTSGYKYLPEIYCPVLVTVQPEIIRNATATHAEILNGQGLFPRLELIPHGRKETGFASVLATGKNGKAYADFIKDMDSIDLDFLPDFETCFSLKFDAEGLARFGHYFDAMEKRESIQDALTLWRSKAGGKLVRLCGLLHLMHGNRIADGITAGTVENAYALLTWFEAVRMAFHSQTDRSTEKHVEYFCELLEKGKDSFRARNFCQKWRHTAREAEDILERMEAQGFICESGRKGRTVWYAINPALSGDAPATVEAVENKPPEIATDTPRARREPNEGQKMTVDAGETGSLFEKMGMDTTPDPEPEDMPNVQADEPYDPDAPLVFEPYEKDRNPDPHPDPHPDTEDLDGWLDPEEPEDIPPDVWEAMDKECRRKTA